MGDHFEERLSQVLEAAADHIEGGRLSPSEIQRSATRRQRRRGVAVSVAGLVFAVLAAGAVSTLRRDDTATTQTVGAPTIEVVERGFSTYQGQYGVQTGSYGIVIRNVGGETVRGIAISVGVFDETGSKTLTERFQVHELRPGQEIGLGDQLTSATGISKVEARVDDPGDQSDDPDDQTDAVGNRLRVSDVATSSDETETRTTFTVASSHRRDLMDVQAFAIWRDTDGRIVGGRFDYIDRIPARGTSTGSVTLRGDLPDVADADVYLNPDLD